MKICISQITTLPADTEQDLAAFAGAGWTAVELAIGKIEKYLSNHSVEQLKQELDRAGLTPVAAIGLASSEAALLLSTADTIDDYFESLTKQLELCQQLNVQNLGIGADHKSLEYSGWQEQAIKNLRRAGDLAQKYDVKIGLEFMSLGPPVGPFVLDTLAATVQLVDEVNHPRIGYNLDLFHHFRGGGTIEEIRSLNIEKLFHVHLCDIPQMPLEQMDDGHRLLPGEGILPIDEIIQILQSKGYDGYYAPELLNQELWDQGPVVTAEKCMKSMEKYIR